MPDRRTELTEISTALGMLGHKDLDRALDLPRGTSPRAGSAGGRPPVLNVPPDLWERLAVSVSDPRHRSLAEEAFANGAAFLAAPDGLRDRLPRRIEWKGPHHPPGYDLLPADLRVDHVYLVSCKYRSQVLMNSSPAHLFDRALQVRGTETGQDWFAQVAPEPYEALYAAVRRLVGSLLPARRTELTSADRRRIQEACGRRWPPEVAPAYAAFSAAVARASARRWAAAVPTKRQRELLLWRMLRLSDSPYFLLGTTSGAGRPLRVRVGTPWDWRQDFILADLQIFVRPGPLLQPRVEWAAGVRDRRASTEATVAGHVEVRWSHGRFSGVPEAKLYLDTPHEEVPGYYPLDATPTGTSGLATSRDRPPGPDARTVPLRLFDDPRAR